MPASRGMCFCFGVRNHSISLPQALHFAFPSNLYPCPTSSFSVLGNGMAFFLTLSPKRRKRPHVFSTGQAFFYACSLKMRAALIRHIFGVVFVCPQKQMIWSDAFSIVTFVKHQKAVGYFAICDFPREFVCIDHPGATATTRVELSISSLSVCTALPVPTLLGLRYTLPKLSDCIIARHRLRTGMTTPNRHISATSFTTHYVLQILLPGRYRCAGMASKFLLAFMFDSLACLTISESAAAEFAASWNPRRQSPIRRNVDADRFRMARLHGSSGQLLRNRRNCAVLTRYVDAHKDSLKTQIRSSDGLLTLCTHTSFLREEINAPGTPARAGMIFCASAALAYRLRGSVLCRFGRLCSVLLCFVGAGGGFLSLKPPWMEATPRV